jgi:hypothetical protein
MPLLRSITRVHRARLRFGILFFLAMGVLTLIFGAIVVGRYVLGWW